MGDARGAPRTAARRERDGAPRDRSGLAAGIAGRRGHLSPIARAPPPRLPPRALHADDLVLPPDEPPPDATRQEPAFIHLVHRTEPIFVELAAAQEVDA